MPATEERKPPYRFLLIVSVILALLHAFVGLSLLPDLPAANAVRWLGAAYLAFSWIVLPLTILSRFIRHRGLADALGWVGSIAMGLFSTLLVFTLLRDVLLALGLLFLPGALEHDSAMWSAVAVPALALLVSLLGFVNARRRARVVNVDVPLRGLPPALEGFTLVQISDIHVGPTIKRRYLDAIVDAVNALDADAIAVTGDVVDGRVEHLAPHTAPLARLKARHGAFFVTGNHEYYSGEAAWSAEFARLGLSVLKNRHVVLEHAGARLVLGGVTDFTSQQYVPEEPSDPQAAIAGAPADAGARVLLAHQPRSADAAAAAGFDLQLSGHTHGGQFWPWNHFVRMQQPYTAGLHCHAGTMWVYTSRGTGYWGPPKRLGAPSEITRLRLIAA
ncbi:serine/threonine protein phosphatase [Acidihalobacter ferrooxydans]|uniref:Serine/threonine protein phosphatase n=2 Tax=Acidihalobacter ferrooxydans TaxID=1765967 RepID=A0A1P8UG77_9GAMM|nr:serine/threonine protein phosphatase [Acidihalobacter ferrooxydans]